MLITFPLECFFDHTVDGWEILRHLRCLKSLNWCFSFAGPSLATTFWSFVTESYCIDGPIEIVSFFHVFPLKNLIFHSFHEFSH